LRVWVKVAVLCGKPHTKTTLSVDTSGYNMPTLQTEWRLGLVVAR